jgi:hypothetical protein
LRFQKFVRHDQRADRRPKTAAAGFNRLRDRDLQPLGFRLLVRLSGLALMSLFRIDRTECCSHYVLLKSSGHKRRFQPLRQVNREDAGPFVINDAKDVPLAYVPCCDDLEGVRFAHNHLTSDEARCVANGIARLPEFMMQRKNFHQRSNGQYRWKTSRPHHVALEDSHIRAHWGFIDAVCKNEQRPV